MFKFDWKQCGIFLFAFLCSGLLFAQNAAVPLKTTVEINGKAVLPSNGTVAGVWFFSDGENSSQLLILGHPNAGLSQTPNYRVWADLNAKDQIRINIPFNQIVDAGLLSCSVQQKAETSATATVLWEEAELPKIEATSNNATNKLSDRIELPFAPSKGISLKIKAAEQPVVVELSHFVCQTSDSVSIPISLDPVRRPQSFDPIPCSPDFRPALEQALIEWDWRMQDGIETPLEPRTYLQAIEKRLPQGLELINDIEENLAEDEDQMVEVREKWSNLTERFNALKSEEATDNAELLQQRETTAEELWKELHQTKREILLTNPLFDVGPMVFAKHVPSGFSHQLTQVYGYVSRPGGGIFVLEEPGKSMKTRLLSGDLPNGNYMHPTVSFDGKKIWFAFCETEKAPNAWHDPEKVSDRYHLYQMNADGSDVKQMTDGDFDDFSPTVLPNGDIIFSSTRRGGFHRCGGGPCFVYTLAKMNADGSDPHPISFHETNEWNPEVLNDGRIVYTRWDYVDRDAVYYQNLWSTRQDGTDVRIYYGNNTFNPCGIWESKSIPGSSKIMAIGAPHHGMSAGSIMLIDTTKGVDGSEPIKRLTPEVLYPEGEVPLPLPPQLPAMSDFDTVIPGAWQAFREADRITTLSEEQKRWPVHCFKSPWPLSEKYFIASYSFDKLLGEAGPNIPNQFGIYFCDAFGNRELVYRDPNISSVWAMPLAERPEKPNYLSTLPEKDVPSTGQFFIQNIYESWPWKMPENIKSLRIVQVLPKTTPNANNPMVGAANASPGKQILGTVPVEEDGSVFFEMPAKTPVLFQALDENGKMVQGMRSLVYLQPGESASCTGCHENRMSSVPLTQSIASKKETPTQIKPGPDGSKPLSYPILVQPVLDRLCVECHNNDKAEGNINLTGEPEGQYTKSYNALIPFVSYTAWGLPEGNYEPMTTPYRFGTHASKLIKILDDGHYDCQLTDEDKERLYSWIDGANALFYGTFNVENQKRQQMGERIEGPDLE
ncbi:MAG: hypothetical protein Q4C95_08225 [Planctomycetia bacterium]|nr:hypothetical protein [Planctomycetia bacterium]